MLGRIKNNIVVTKSSSEVETRVEQTWVYLPWAFWGFIMALNPKPPLARFS